MSCKNYILVEGSEDLVLYSYIIKNIFAMEINTQNICTNIDCELKISGGRYNFKTKLNDLYLQYDKNSIDISKIGIIRDRDSRDKKDIEQGLNKIFADVFKELSEKIEFYTFIYEDFSEIEKLLYNTKILDSKIADCFLENFIKHCQELDKNEYQLKKMAYKNWLSIYLEVYCSKHLGLEANKTTLKSVLKNEKVQNCFDLNKDEKFLLEFENFLNNFKE